MTTWMEIGDLKRTHPSSQCDGEVCVIHNPSEHHMLGWPIAMRETLILRICPHGNKHPDPDSLGYFERHYGSIDTFMDRYRGHTCDGCCGMENVPEPHRYLTRNAVRCKRCGDVLESLYRHDYRECECENQTMVDGGLAYERYGGKDMSLIEPLFEYETD
jgi:hypothetical protein